MITAPTIISEGTLRAEDLREKFEWALNALPNGPETLKRLTREWAEIDISDDEVVEELTDALNDHAAPLGLWFGAAEGDSACFGFWAVSDEEVAEQIRELDDDELLHLALPKPWDVQITALAACDAGQLKLIAFKLNEADLGNIYIQQLLSSLLYNIADSKEV